MNPSERSARKLALIVDQYGYIGGGQIVLLGIIEAFLVEGMDVELIAPKGGDLESTVVGLFKEGVTMIHHRQSELPSGKKNLLDSIKLLSDSFSFAMSYCGQAKRAKVIYVNGPRWMLGAAMMSLLSRVPIVFHLHKKHSLIEKFLLSICLLISRTPVVVSNSSFTIADEPIFSRIWMRFACVHVVENCLARSYFELPYQTYVNDGIIRCSVVGLLCREKGQDLVVEVAKSMPEVEFHIIGRIGKGAEKWAKDLFEGASPNVFFHGEITNWSDFIRQRGIAVNIVPSRWAESFGLVAIEGMACSCFTIVSRKGALPEIAKNTGAEIFENNANSLREKLQKVQSLSEMEIEKLRRVQFESVKKLYSPDRFRSEMRRLIRDF